MEDQSAETKSEQKQMYNHNDWNTIRNYQAADKPRKITLKENVLLLIEALKAIFLVIPIILKSVLRLFVPPKPKKIVGEVALVTGGGNGLGRGIAIELAKRGAKVAVCDLDEEAAMTTINIIKTNEGQNHEARSYKCDAANPADMRNLRDKITMDFKEPVSILINNVGLLSDISITTGTDEDHKNFMNVSLLSHFWSIRTFLPTMKERNHGHIVLISSMLGYYGMNGCGVYSTAKFALRGLAESLYRELDYINSDIKTTIVHPYYINTRKSLADRVNLSVKIPPMSVEDASFQIVDGMRRNYMCLTVPRPLLYFTLMVNLLPFKAQDVFMKINQKS